jgi:hypothetical protein
MITKEGNFHSQGAHRLVATIRFFGFILGISFVLAGRAQSPLQEPTVKLLDAGSEPRRALRMHSKAGDTESTVMTMKMSMEMPGAAAGGQAIKIPAMSMPMDLTVQSVAPNGDITYTMVMREPGVADEPGANPMMVQAMKTALATFKGLAMNGVVSDRGLVKQIDMKIPADADPTMRQSMDQMKDNMSNMGAPFPQEAIGPGAKWEVKTHINSGGIAVEQTATYQLASLNGDQWSAKCTMDQNAGKQAIQNPSLGSAKMNLLKLTSKGGGTINSDLSRIVPLHGNVDVHLDMASEIVMAQTNQPMTMKMDMNIKMESK